MLGSGEYAVIKADYDRVSRQHFPRSYTPPAGMTFAQSDALFPPPELRAVLAAEFDKQCRTLCFGPLPTWDEMWRPASLEFGTYCERPLGWQSLQDFAASIPATGGTHCRPPDTRLASLCAGEWQNATIKLSG
jgi:hypothetical protein